MSKPKRTSSPDSGWQLEFARLIVYAAKPPVPLEQNWWLELVPQKPEDFVSTQKMRSREDRGSMERGVLTLTVDHNRVEWLVQPGAESQGTPDNLPTLGPFQESYEWVVQLLSPWLEKSCPPIRRLAFGGKLLQFAETWADAYSNLARHLPWVKLEPNPNDFILQVNRRTDSTTVTELPINRVSTWSKMNMAFEVEPGVPFEWPQKCCSTLELDINTAPEKTDAVPHESLAELFKELANLGARIAKHGDEA